MFLQIAHFYGGMKSYSECYWNYDYGHCDYDHGIVEQRIEVAKHN